MISKIVRCPKCKNEIRVNGEPKEKIILVCNKCKSKGKYIFPEKQVKGNKESIAIEVNGLIKSYNGLRAVDNISFNVKQGELVGFIGPNGAGKSTTIKMLTGILFPGSGNMRVLGLDPQKQRKKLLPRLSSCP